MTRVERGFCASQYEVWSGSGSLSHHQTPTSIVINRRVNDTTVPYVNLRIFNCIGSKCTICAPLTLTFADVKRKVVAEFHARRQLFLTPCHTKSDSTAATATAVGASSSRDRIEEQKMSCDNLDLVQLSRHYKLARISKLHETFDEQSSLATANVKNNEEMLLVLCSANAAPYLNAAAVQSNTKDLTMSATTITTTPPTSTTTNLAKQSMENLATNRSRHLNLGSESDSDIDDATATSLTQLDIDLATAHLKPNTTRGPNVVNIDELVLQSDVQYDIRKILISLANSCAYVIGAGPYAARIISMLKQRLVQRKQHEQDTQQCLIEMGFSRPKVQHALNINK